MRLTDILAVLAVWCFVALPLFGMLSFGDAMNDKPWGYHATPVSYWRAAGIGLAATAVVALAARIGGRSGRPLRCVFLGVIAAVILGLAYCMGDGVTLLMEDRTQAWYR